MYHEYFGLKEPAFSIAVNPKYLYMSSQHKEALAHLIYGVQGGGFVLLSGEVGTGKTTIIRCLLEQLPKDTEIAFVLNSMAGVEALLSTICEELHIPCAKNLQASIKEMMDGIQAHLLQNHAQGKRTVLLIDEAQLLSADVLEQIRLLTNLETNTQKLLQIILVGQPEVNELLNQPRLRQLSQRITARFHLDALTLEESTSYIEHRLQIAGKKEGRSIFPNKIIKQVHAFSGGIPRLINILCERLLVGAYGHNKYEIDQQIYQLAIKEVAGVKLNEPHLKKPTHVIRWSAAIACAACIVALSVWATYTTFTKPADVITNNKSTQANTQNTASTAKTIEPKLKKASFLFEQSGQAYLSLFTYYGITATDESHPCWQTQSHLHACSKLSVDTWSDIDALNRPVLLELVTQAKSQAYALVTGMTNTQIIVLNNDGSMQAVAKDELGPLWQGKLTYLWKKPIAYEKPISLGVSSPVVTQVAHQFALLDQQEKPITRSVFTQRLQTRIKIFQADNNLESDGIIGEQTLMKLNETLGDSVTLLRALPADSQG